MKANCISFVIAKELLNKRKAEVMRGLSKENWKAAKAELKAIEDELWLLSNY